MAVANGQAGIYKPQEQKKAANGAECDANNFAYVGTIVYARVRAGDRGCCGISLGK